MSVTQRDGTVYVVEVVPTGYPINDWGDFDLVLAPIWWLRRRLWHSDEFSVIVHRPRKYFGGLRRAVHREAGMDLAEARDRMALRAGELQEPD